MFALILVVLLTACGDTQDDSAPDTGPSPFDCEDGLDGDGDGFVDYDDPDCERRTQEESVFNGPVVGLDLEWEYTGGEGGPFLTLFWMADEGWPSSLTATLTDTDSAQHEEVHQWADVSAPLVLVFTDDEWEPGETTWFKPGSVLFEDWRLCAEHPLEDDPICVQGH